MDLAHLCGGKNITELLFVLPRFNYRDALSEINPLASKLKFNARYALIHLFTENRSLQFALIYHGTALRQVTSPNNDFLLVFP